MTLKVRVSIGLMPVTTVTTVGEVSGVSVLIRLR